MTKFKSKKDVIAYLVILLPSLILIAIAISLFINRVWPAAIVVLVGGLTNLSMWFVTFYQFQEDQLFIRCGPFRWKIPISSIERVRKSTNMVSGPALARDRLEITHTKGFVLISPAREEEFISLLRLKNSGVRIDINKE